ncbi:hypothetical protein FNV43_RR14856 [Rhamnella rubrinervis]|uniref:Uncharacterized protein n=1 Tax=Rhamnella rubrinervis TaxID=2594499 RepID=A0A8K0MGU1_9ROSA|nr:hypothetical protein FNV43_RR14856 [Rhamnella rubrinervis]
MHFESENLNLQLSVVKYDDSVVIKLIPSKVVYHETRIKKLGKTIKSSCIVTTKTQDQLKNTLLVSEKFDSKWLDSIASECHIHVDTQSYEIVSRFILQDDRSNGPIFWCAYRAVVGNVKFPDAPLTIIHRLCLIGYCNKLL